MYMVMMVISRINMLSKQYLENQLRFWCLSVAPYVAPVTKLGLRSPMLTRQIIGIGREVYSI